MPRKVLGYGGFEYFADKIKSEIANKTTSWNDLTDRPFYSETTEGINIELDTTGTPVEVDLSGMSIYYYKIPNVDVEAEDLIGATVAFNVGDGLDTLTVEQYDSSTDGIYSFGDTAVGVSLFVVAENTSEVFTETGLYLLYTDMGEGMVVSTKSITKEAEETIHKLDSKYLPDSVGNEHIINASISPDFTSRNSVVVDLSPSEVSDATEAASDGKRLIVELTVQMLNQKVRIPLDALNLYGSTTFNFSGKLLNLSVTFNSTESNLLLEVKELLSMPVQKIADYLYYLDINFDLNYEKAKNYVITNTDMACSAVRNGNYLGRNLDNKYNETAEFICRTKATKGRHASVSVCSMLTDITDAEANSGAWNDLYEIVPFCVMDGINDKGVAVEMNTVSGIEDFHTEIDRSADLTVSTAMLGRFILDYANSAADAIDLLNTINIIQPPTEHAQELHYMIADKDETYVVEFVPDGNGGVSIEAMQLPAGLIDKPISTNFYLSVYSGIVAGYGGGTVVGSGFGRYEDLANNYASSATKQGMTDLMKSVYYAEYYGIELTERDGTEGHTIHSSVYDFEGKTLTIIPQPDNPNANEEAFTFAVNDGALVNSANEQIFYVDGTVDLTDYSVANLSKSYAEILNAYNTGKEVKARLVINHPTFGTVVLILPISLVLNHAVVFNATIYTNLGDGEKFHDFALNLRSEGNAEIHIDDMI